MTDVTQGVIAKIGTGTKSHITTIYTDGGETYIEESACGSVKKSGWTRSRTLSTGIVSEQSFELVAVPDAPQPNSENRKEIWASRHQAISHNHKAAQKAKLSLETEFLALGNACSKCVANLTWISKLQ